MGSPSLQDRQRIEAVLRARLEDAERRWRSCKEYRGDRDAWGVAENADSLSAARRSITEYSMALAAYSQALREWTDFTLHRKVPGWLADATAHS